MARRSDRLASPSDFPCSSPRCDLTTWDLGILRFGSPEPPPIRRPG